MLRRVAVVALLVSLAGCGGVFDAPESTETVTPAPVPAAASTVDGGRPLPPGLGGGGVYNASALAAAHLDALAGASYTWHARMLFDENSSEQHLAVEAPRRYVYTHTSPGSQANTSEFADGEVVYTRYYRFVTRLRRAPATNATSRYGPITAGAIERYLAVENATVAETLVDGDRHYRVRATADRYRPIDGAANYTVSAVVRPDGFVRELAVSYVNRGGDRPVPVEYRYEYSDLGTTTVERPQWLGGDEWATNPTETPG